MLYTIDFPSPHLMRMPCICMHGKYFRIGYQIHSEFVKPCQLSSQHQRRTHDTPECQHGDLLILCEIRPVIHIIYLPYRSDRKHIGIRPVPCTCMGAPFSALENISYNSSHLSQKSSVILHILEICL